MENLFDSLFDTRAQNNMQQTGMSYVIRVIPNLFTGEVLNIGITVITTEGRRAVKVIDEPGRLTCLYGEQAAESLVFLAQIAKEAAESGAPSPSHNIIYSDPLPFFNMHPEDALNHFFKDQVTVAIPFPDEKRKTQEKKLRTDDVRAKVYSLIKQKTSAFSGDSLIAQSSFQAIPTPNGDTRNIIIPLLPKNGIGGLESADYTNQSLKLHLMDALLDIECVAKHKGFKKLGLFIAKPENVPAYRTTEIENAIDYVMWRAPSECKVVQESNLDRLTEEILEWDAAA